MHNLSLIHIFDVAIPTEAEQIESIDQAESEKSPSAFVLSQAEIENALRRGSNFEDSKLRIWQIYQMQPDRKLRAKALAKEYAPYGPGGSSHTYLDGSSGWLDHDSKGLTLSLIHISWAYIKELQASFDYSKIKYTKEYYDVVDLSLIHI